MDVASGAEAVGGLFPLLLNRVGPCPAWANVALVGQACADGGCCLTQYTG